MLRTTVLLAGLGAAILAAPALAQAAFAEWDDVEVLDPVNDVWNACTVLKVFPGAYKVACNGEQSIQRDVNVRSPGGEQPGQTDAAPVNGPPFKRNDIVLASPMGLANDWRLCVIVLNQVAKSNTYVVDCGYSNQHVLPKWVRRDPKAP